MNELVTRQTKTGLAISTETKELIAVKYRRKHPFKIQASFKADRRMASFRRARIPTSREWSDVE